jgi:uncharacterized delta-60 repeat protein
MRRFRSASKSRRTSEIQKLRAVECLEQRTLLSGLELILGAAEVIESAGTAATYGTVTRTGASLSQAQIVYLSSNDTTEAAVPASIVIPGGEASATFPIDAVDDVLFDGSQLVAISAETTFNISVLPDNSFAGGSSISSMSHDAYTLAPLADGRFYVAGLRWNTGGTTTYDLGVTRFLPDGQPDPTFGAGGTVISDLTPGTEREQPYAMLVQPDGKLLVGGTILYGVGPHYEMFVVRYNTNGSLDTTFGSGGKFILSLGSDTHSEATGLALLPGGGILVGGYIDNRAVTPVTYADFAVVRLTPTGQRDLSSGFGSSGIVKTNIVNSDKVFDMLVQPDGKIVLAGAQGGTNLSSQLTLARYSTSGTLDTTFGTGGIAAINVPGEYDTAYDVTLQPDGKFVVAGEVSTGGIGTAFKWALARFNANGSADTSFGTGGYTTRDFLGADRASSVLVLADGTIVVSGHGAGDIADGQKRPIMASFAPDGTFLERHVSSRIVSNVRELAVQDGRLLVVGEGTLINSGFVEAYAPSGGGTAFASAPLWVDDDEPDLAPTAVDDAYTVFEDQVLVVSSEAGVLANDIDNGPLATSLVSGPSHGTLTLNPDGSFTYEPHANFFGTNSFVYQATDALLQTSTATVTITVYAVDDLVQNTVPPAQTTAEDSWLTLSAANGNAITVADLDTVELRITLSVGDGSLMLASTAGLTFLEGANGSGTMTFSAPSPVVVNAALEGMLYTPPANYHGQTTLTIRSRDWSYVTYVPEDLDTVAINVTTVNDAPVAVSDGTYTAVAGQTFSATAPGVLANDLDLDGDALTAILVAGPGQGTLTLNLDGSFVYTPGAFSSGPDSFTYRNYDGIDQSEVVTVAFDIAPNMPPLATDDAFSVHEDNVLAVSASGVLANDSDPQSQPLTAVLVQGPSRGELTLGDDGAFVYTPHANYHGSDNFTYHASDGTHTSDIALVSITVSPVNDAPVAVADSFSSDEDIALIIQIADLLANDSDADSDELHFALHDQAQHGWVTVNPTGTILYTPLPDFFGVDTFRYRVLDDFGGQSAPATVTITVNPVPDAPVAVADAFTQWEDQPLTIDFTSVLANDLDPDADPLTAALLTGPAHGSLTFHTDGTFVYAPSAHFNGIDSFTYVASDGAFLSDPATVTIEFLALPDAPVASSDFYELDEDAVLFVNPWGVLANVRFRDGAVRL